MREATICSVMSVLLSASLSVCPHGTTRLPPDEFSRNLIFHNFRKFVKIFKFHLTLIRITSTLHEDLCTFMIICHWSLLRIRNVSDKTCRGNQYTLYTFKILFFFPENRAVYEIIWENIVEWSRPQMMMWRMWIACWEPKVTDTRSEYVILIAFHGNIGYRKALC